MDITPYIGILGAVVGGSIGLFGQRMNLKEQRRKDLRERVVNLLRDADRIDVLSVRCMNVIRAGKHKRFIEMLPELGEATRGTRHHKQYLDLTAPWILRYWVGELQAATTRLSSAAMDRSEADDPETSEKEYEAASARFTEARNGLVQHLRPDINDVPWWTRKPVMRVIKLVLRPLRKRVKPES